VSGRVVCVTGASAGIGRETAKLFARKKDHIVIGARRVDRLEELCSELTTLGAASVLALPLDVRDQSSITNFVSKVQEKHKNKCDVLVNNAGLVLGVDHMADGKIDEWETVIDTNVMGVLRMTRMIVPIMKENNAGHIVMMGSISGHQVYEGGGPYCASKFAVKAISQTLRLELNGTNIRVTSIDPGMVETEFSLVRFNNDSDRAKAVYKGFTPLSPKDIADCVEFAVERPAHVNIDDIIIMPTAQASVSKTSRKS
jgi:NADP-dependent 3-hydroxy acid dehydrogenase YdfG